MVYTCMSMYSSWAINENLIGDWREISDTIATVAANSNLCRDEVSEHNKCHPMNCFTFVIVVTPFVTCTKRSLLTYTTTSGYLLHARFWSPLVSTIDPRAYRRKIYNPILCYIPSHTQIVSSSLGATWLDSAQIITHCCKISISSNQEQKLTKGLFTMVVNIVEIIWGSYDDDPNSHNTTFHRTIQLFQTQNLYFSQSRGVKKYIS